MSHASSTDVSRPSSVRTSSPSRYTFTNGAISSSFTSCERGARREAAPSGRRAARAPCRPRPAPRARRRPRRASMRVEVLTTAHACVRPPRTELDVVDAVLGDRGADSPQTGQFGSRRSLTSLNSVASASKRSSRPTSDSPIPRQSLSVSLACSEPMIPGRTPRTPPSEHDGASSGGGGSGNRQR